MRSAFTERIADIHISLGSISSVLQIFSTVSKDAPPIPRERTVITVLYGTSAASANCLRLTYLSSIALRSLSSLFAALFNDLHLNAVFNKRVYRLIGTIPIGDNFTEFTDTANSDKSIRPNL